MSKIPKSKKKSSPDSEQPPAASNDSHIDDQKEYGGPKGKEPTRYGDWEMKGRCIDF